MGKIFKAIEHMHEELEGAYDYAEMAILLKKEDHAFADKLIRASDDELRHAVMFHDRVAFLIEECKRKSENNSWLDDMWEHEHKKEIHMMEKIRMLHTEYSR